MRRHPRPKRRPFHPAVRPLAEVRGLGGGDSGGRLVPEQAADQIAVITGIGQTFIGSTLLAASTSLPELSVTIFTARMGAYDLLLGNMLGSNIFNMVILLVSDLFQPGSTPILSTGTTGQVVSALVGLVLSGHRGVALTLPRREVKFKFSWEMWLILAGYLVGLRMIYLAG